MRLLLDAHLSKRVAEALRTRGYDVVCVTEVGLERARDDAIWESAIAEGRLERLLEMDLDLTDQMVFLGPA